MIVIFEIAVEAFLRGVPASHRAATSALAVARNELAILLAIESAETPPALPAVRDERELLVALTAAIAAGDEVRISTVLGAVRAAWDEMLGRCGDYSAIYAAINVLAFPPIGSPAMLLHASRLSAGGLGPYFRNAHRLLPDPGQMLGLAASVADDLTAPLALLASWLPSAALHDLVDAIADLGLIAPLHALMRHAERAARHGEFAPLWAIRDAALDLGAHDLGLSSQRCVVRWRPGVGLEQAILGRMLLSADRDAEAELAFAAAKACDGVDPMRQPATRGFGTDPGRWCRRMRRRVESFGRD